MTTPPSDIQPQRVFTPRRRRALLSFRRKRDVVWFLISFGMFCVGLTAMGYTVYQFRARGVHETRPPLPAAQEPAAAEPVPAPEPVASPVTPPEPPRAAEPSRTEPPRTEPPKAETPRAEAAPKVEPPPAVKTPKPTGGLALLEKNRTFRPFVDKNARLTAQVVEKGGLLLTLEYDLARGQWVQAFAEVSQDFSKFTRVQFSYQGSGAQNTLEFKMVDADGSNVGTFWTRRTGREDWTKVDMALKDLAYLWGGDATMNWPRVRQIFFAVSQKPGDEGGKGRVVIRNLRFY